MAAQFKMTSKTKKNYRKVILKHRRDYLTLSVMLMGEQLLEKPFRALLGGKS
jgi:ribosomal protein L32